MSTLFFLVRAGGLHNYSEKATARIGTSRKDYKKLFGNTCNIGYLIRIARSIYTAQRQARPYWEKTYLSFSQLHLNLFCYRIGLEHASCK